MLNAPMPLCSVPSSFTHTLRDEYRALWGSCGIMPGKLKEVREIVTRILRYKPRYRSVESVSNVPWQVVAVIHSLEAGGDFDTHLHNGDPLTRRTVHVPKGRPTHGTPPFSWEESAVDALNYDGLDSNKRWDIAGTLYELEGFNGWGYRRYHPAVLTPYLWSYTTHYTAGKYVDDGHFDPKAVSRQCGCVPILMELGYS